MKNHWITCGFSSPLQAAKENFSRLTKRLVTKPSQTPLSAPGRGLIRGFRSALSLPKRRPLSRKTYGLAVAKAVDWLQHPKTNAQPLQQEATGLPQPFPWSRPVSALGKPTLSTGCAHALQQQFSIISEIGYCAIDTFRQPPLESPSPLALDAA